MRISDSSMHDAQYLCGFSKNPVVGWMISFWDDLLRLEVVDGTPDSGMPIESPQLRPERDFGSTPIHTTWIPLKSIVEHFRALLRDFRFWAIFWFSESKKILIFGALTRIKEKRRMDSSSHPPQMVIQRWALDDKITCTT